MAQTYVVIDANSCYFDGARGEFDYTSSVEVQSDSPAEACAIAREQGFDGLLFAGLKDLPVRIEVTVDASVQSRDWHRVATKRACAAAAEQGIAWEDADVFVYLPEPGRCFTKSPGRITLVAYGQGDNNGNTDL